jgi:uncharacterized damage-inducible protein DinB
MGALPDLYRGEARGRGGDAEIEVEHELARIRSVVASTAEAARAAVEAAPEGERGELPHPSAEAYLLHMIVHAAHHRGQILLALKTNGFPLPDEGAVWGPWKGG